MATPTATQLGDALIAKMDQTSPPDCIVQSCVACQKPAHLHCQACFHSEAKDGSHKATWYCSKECQVTDRPSHKSHCREISSYNQLSPGARLMQKAFYLFRKHTFDVPVACLSRQDSRNLCIHHSPEPNPDEPQMLFPFPTAIPTTSEIEEALLAFGACELGVAQMYPLFVSAFAGIYKRIDEFCCDVKNPKLEISVELGPGEVNPPMTAHWILRVFLKSGKIYAIDVASAHLGWYEPVLPWDVFVEQRLGRFREVREFGYMKSIHDNWQIPFADDLLISSLWNSKVVGGSLDKSVEKWLKSKETTLAAVLKLKPQDEQLRSAEVLEASDIELTKYVRGGPKAKELVFAITNEKRGKRVSAPSRMGDGSKRTRERILRLE